MWLVLTLLACIPILIHRASSPSLLADTDTVALLRAIRERQTPMSWFVTDWPLENHFYRPLPTLTFELDNALYGDWAAGYGLTNAVLAALCVVALFWMLRELFDSPSFGFCGAALFVLWTLDRGELLVLPVVVAALLSVIIGFIRHGLEGSRYLPAAFVLVFLATQVGGVQPLAGRMIEWLPGRTASVMALFALLAMAAYARYERIAASPAPPSPLSSMDPPAATRTTTAASSVRVAWIWPILAALCAGASFASYEQAVMLPACLLGIAVVFRLRGRKPHWWLHVGFWVLLGGYLLLRAVILPSETSGYQSQQLRFGSGVWLDLSDYVLPNAATLPSAWIALELGLFALLTPNVLATLAGVAATVVTAVQTRRNGVTVLAGWALSSLAFLPMAWLKFFAHYHYWPMALRTILVLGVVKVAWDLLSIAACPPTLPAPRRPVPAPGSLPRP